MAYNFEQFNKGKFNVDTTGFLYKNLKDLYTDDPDTVYTVRGIYINDKSKFGPAPLFALDNFYVNIPSHLLDVCQKMISDSEAVADINAGKMGFRIYTYEGNSGTTCYSVAFVNK